MATKTLAETLKESIEEGEWSWLSPHAARDAIIIVDSGLTLLEVGVEVANNNISKVQAWIQSGLIFKPKQEQIAAWNQTLDKRFTFLIVQPYVLVQELLHS